MFLCLGQHFGAAKTWYGVPASGSDKFEAVVMDHLRESAKPGTYKSVEELRMRAVQLLLDKATMFTPKLLLDAGLSLLQKPCFPLACSLCIPHQAQRLVVLC